MKKILLLFFFVILIVFVVIIGREMLDDKQNNVTFIQEEIDSIKKINTEKISGSSPYFDTSIIIRNTTNERIEVEVNILNPKIEMKQVVVSAYLGDSVLTYINTPHALVSNILAVKNSEGKSFSENFNISPNGDIHGISASSSMMYFNHANLQDVLKEMPYILIKCSWLDEQNQQKIVYIKYPKDKYIINKQ